MYAFAWVSGTHISSTVTIGASLSGYASWIRLGAFLVAQVGAQQPQGQPQAWTGREGTRRLLTLRGAPAALLGCTSLPPALRCHPHPLELSGCCCLARRCLAR